MRNRKNLLKHIMGWGKLSFIFVAFLMGASILIDLIASLWGKPFDQKKSIITSVYIVLLFLLTSIATWYFDPEMFDNAENDSNRDDK